MPDSGKSRQLPSKHSAVPLQELERVRSLCWAGLVRGRFKYLRVSVRDGRVRVSVSNRVSKAVVAEFIESHLEQVARWLAEQEEKKLLRRQNDPLCADYRHEGHIGYQGQVLGIRCMEHLQQTRLSDDARELWVRASQEAKPEVVGREVSRWLQSRFAERLPQRAAYWSARTGLRPSGIKSSGAKGRWGSCSQSGVVRIAWRTICLPPEVLDYVLVHELVHLRHFNHSAAFWKSVRDFYPQADRVRAILKQVRASELA